MPHRTKTLYLLGYNIQVITKRITTNDGFYFPRDNKIEVDRKQSPQQRLSRLFHEALHAMVDKQSLAKYFRGSSEKKRDENEESFIEGMEPALVSLLVDNGIDLSPFEQMVE